MGLDLYVTRIDDDPAFHARWSYGGFAAFRKRVAEQLGINLDTMQGFGGETEWPDPNGEPLIYLLNHSDCDGDLDYTACDLLGPRLREFVETWPDADGYDKDNALRLAAMCIEVANGDAEGVVFR